MINPATPPTTLPTMTPVWFFGPPGLLLVLTGGGAELDIDIDEVKLLLGRFVPLGVASGLAPMAMATTSLYVWFGRVVTLMYAHRGTSVPIGMSYGYCARARLIQ